MKIARKIRFGIAILRYLIYNIIVARKGAVRGIGFNDFNCLYESLRGRNGRA